MFNSLKEKLRLFRKKAKEEIEREDSPERTARSGPDMEKESKFLNKVRRRSGRPSDSGPKPNQEPAGGISVDEAVSDSGLKGDDILKSGSIGIREKGGLFAKRISDKKLDEVMFDLEMALLESDVAHPVVERIKGYVSEELRGARVDRKTDLEDIIGDALRKAIRKVLSVKKIDFDRFVKESEKPVVVMFVGVNGTGKTTAIARIAHRLQKNHVSCVLAAGDTFRAGAIEQLTKHSERLGLRIIKHKSGSDPAAVAYDSIEHAKARRKDVVLLDTAGRMQTNINLMDEMKKIKRIANPSLIIFVGDSLAGNDAVIQAQKFDEAVGIDCAILTKIDADAKGGAALSIAYTIGKPIIFLGTGQDYNDLIPFDPDWMTQRLFEE